MSDLNKYIQHFDDGREPTLETLGGKGASLVSMTAAGMPVPPGFVVTTAHFEDFRASQPQQPGIAERLESLDPEDTAAVDALSAEIRRVMEEHPVPAEIRATLDEAYDQLMERCGGEVPVAVRSSATAEDLPDASFAGQQDTYLWITGRDAVAEHIRRCWASLYTSRAIIYRLKNDIPNVGLAMAVVVQKMANARVAGVAMTLNPATGDRSKLAVDASWGVGEMVVSGEVTPDHLLLDKVTLHVVTEHIGDKHAELVPDPDRGALVHRDVPAERRDSRCLTDDELRAVAEMAKRAEKHYGCPQDIEWALDADLPPGEDLLLLQSRPETVHSGKADEEKPRAEAAPMTGAFDLSSITSSFTAVKPAS